jgi:hypothetical protein
VYRPTLPHPGAGALALLMQDLQEGFRFSGRM